jgi:exonuclease VII large subunit
MNNQEEIVREFANQMMVQDDEQQPHASRMTSWQQQLEQHEREIEHVRRSHRLASLDLALDEMAARFSDAAVALEYDVNVVSSHNLDQTKDHTKRGTNNTEPCLGPRAHWMDCVKKYAVDTRPCNAYMTALEMCVQEAIVKRNQS